MLLLCLASFERTDLKIIRIPYNIYQFKGIKNNTYASGLISESLQVSNKSTFLKT